MTDLQGAELVQQIRQQLLAYLRRREYSRKELKTRLLAKGFTGELIEQQLDYFADQGWQSDSRYAEQQARSLARKGYASRVIDQRLRQAGLASVSLTEALPDYSWQSVILANVQKRQSLLVDEKGRNKLVRWLLARGFDYGQIQWAIKEFQSLD